MLTAILGFLAGNMLYLALRLESSSFPRPLTPEREKECFEQMHQGSTAARDELISHNLRLVAHVVKKYYPGTADNDDLISIGTIGLIKAVNSFSSEKHTRFSTFAAKCIENEVLMFFRSGRKMGNTISLSEPIDSEHGDSDLTVGDVLSDDVQVEEACERRADAARLSKLVDAVLDGRERQIIRLRYGFGGAAQLTQQEVAAMLGISRSYVSRLETKALTKLREEFDQGKK